MFASPPRTAARLAGPTDRPWATGIKETLARRTHSITVSVQGTRLRHVIARPHTTMVGAASFQVVRISSDRRRGEEALALRVDPHEAEHWTA